MIFSALSKYVTIGLSVVLAASIAANLYLGLRLDNTKLKVEKLESEVSELKVNNVKLEQLIDSCLKSKDINDEVATDHVKDLKKTLDKRQEKIEEQNRIIASIRTKATQQCPTTVTQLIPTPIDFSPALELTDEENAVLDYTNGSYPALLARLLAGYPNPERTAP